jgi:ribosomal protein S18 acetylase RimI-like enzyme
VLAAAGLGALAAFSRGGLELELACTAPGLPSWTPALEAWAFALTRANMRALYEQAAKRDSSWRWRDARKREELFDAESRFLVARERRRPRPPAADDASGEGRAAPPLAAQADADAVPAAGAATAAATLATAATGAGGGGSGSAGVGAAGVATAEEDAAPGAPVAFLCFRFMLDGPLEVLYVYELQLEERAQRRGLGRHLMMTAELAARKLGMSSVMLTVLKANAAARDFYTLKMKYAVDDDSPSKCGVPDAEYEILSKVVDKAAHAASMKLVEEGAIVL